uniref:Uncharacterized protein n=1 Tax=Anguilla anguilla TaxID=7936 RepID=A0A0E9S232_ANGAN
MRLYITTSLLQFITAINMTGLLNKKVIKKSV